MSGFGVRARCRPWGEMGFQQLPGAWRLSLSFSDGVVCLSSFDASRPLSCPAQRLLIPPTGAAGAGRQHVELALAPPGGGRRTLHSDVQTPANWKSAKGFRSRHWLTACRGPAEHVTPQDVLWISGQTTRGCGSRVLPRGWTATFTKTLLNTNTVSLQRFGWAGKAVTRAPSDPTHLRRPASASLARLSPLLRRACGRPRQKPLSAPATSETGGGPVYHSRRARRKARAHNFGRRQQLVAVVTWQLVANSAFTARKALTALQGNVTLTLHLRTRVF